MTANHEDAAKMPERYKLQVGKWGMYVHDTLSKCDIDMEQVLERLNTRAALAAPEQAAGEVARLERVLQTEHEWRLREGMRADKAELALEKLQAANRRR